MTILIRKGTGCFFVWNVTGMESYSATRRTFKFVRNAEASGSSRKKTSRIIRKIGERFLIRDKKQLKRRLQRIRRCPGKPPFQDFFKFAWTSRDLCLPIYWAKRWRQLPSEGSAPDSTTFPHCPVDSQEKPPFRSNLFRLKFISLNSRPGNAEFAAMTTTEFYFGRETFYIERFL